ncbi:hypothetical protein SPI_06460 [Niveomyces insectorum RCEF 264]|uniref:Uncharacterized protein n=1 Tax=Niveomyces insectorum RCEF 264 TaxID=1081102 RepID=A0A167R9I6_9HYPO|nr:hypothetical protein SPI_06460 [Niveomyces insectorum RCEF 264]
MLFTNTLLAFAGFNSLALAAPAVLKRKAGVVGRHIVPRGSIVNIESNNINVEESNTIIVQQTVVQPSVTVVEENLDLVSQLALIAEQEFSELVQSQLALVQEVETIKNNIRVNHFRARFAEVNTVIVCVTELVDLRNGGSRNTRYMVNQLLADNGHPQKSVVVMLTAASPVTINTATPTLDLSGLLGANGSAGLPSNVVASVVAAASASAAVAAAAAASSSSAFSNSSTTGANSSSNNTETPQVAAFDPNNPYGQINQTVILPYGSKAPSLPNGAQIMADPASIILPNQNNLLIEDITEFNADCSLYNRNELSLFNLQSEIVQTEQISVVEVSGLSLGSVSSLNLAAAALLGGGSSGISSNIGGSSGDTNDVSLSGSTTTTAADYSTSTTINSGSSSSATAAASSASSATVVVNAAAVPPVSTASTAPAAPGSAPGGGVGVQMVPVPVAAAA